MWAVDRWWWVRNHDTFLMLLESNTTRIVELEKQLERERLSYARHVRALIEKFRVYLEDPEEDIRDILEDAMRDLDDEVARAEEHILD